MGCASITFPEYLGSNDFYLSIDSNRDCTVRFVIVSEIIGSHNELAVVVIFLAQDRSWHLIRDLNLLARVSQSVVAVFPVIAIDMLMIFEDTLAELACVLCNPCVAFVIRHISAYALKFIRAICFDHITKFYYILILLHFS